MNPPAWKAARGSNDRPIITQKMASEPKPQARSTVAKATCRMCSMATPRIETGPARVSCRESWGGAITSGWLPGPAGGGSKPGAEEIAHGRQREQARAGKPDPEGCLGRVVLRPDHVLVDGGGDTAENDRRRRDHQ